VRDVRQAYREVNWGNDPRRTTSGIVIPSGYGRPVTTLKAISYVSPKGSDQGGKPAVYRHEFGKFGGRGPYLLEVLVGTQGPHRLPNPATDTAALGRVIDFETEDGERIFTPFLWVCTTVDALEGGGGPVLLASRSPPKYAIEHRRVKNLTRPYIRRHGIID